MTRWNRGGRAPTILDALGQGPEAVVVLHVGGTEAALDRFRAGFELLSDAARGI